MRFWQEESGLNTLEYIIGAGIMVGLCLTFLQIPLDAMKHAGNHVGGVIRDSAKWVTHW